jgi:hypothetical protein
MTIDGLRRICMSLPAATEDIKWGADLAFSVGGKMFCVVNIEPPHQMSFKCTPEEFAELIERESSPRRTGAGDVEFRRVSSAPCSSGGSSRRCSVRRTTWCWRNCPNRSGPARRPPGEKPARSTEA